MPVDPAAHPHMTEVKSSNVHSVGHDGSALFVRFRAKGGVPGPLYRYPTAGNEHHEALLVAQSPGSYVIDRLRHSHRGEKME